MRNKFIIGVILGACNFIGSNDSIAQDLESDLVLDMGFSNEVTDLTGNTVPVSSLGTETFIEDRFGNPSCAIRFNGVAGEYIEVPVASETAFVNGNEAFSISLWFRMNNLNGSDYESFFEKDTTGGAAGPYFGMGVYDGNTPLVFDKEDHAFWDNDWNSDADLSTDTSNWHHMVMVVEDSLVTMYRDNEVRGEYYYDYYAEEDFDIGDLSANYFLGRYFKGYLDDLKMYSRVLTTAEVTMLYELEGNCGALSISKQDKTSELTILVNDHIVTFKNSAIGAKNIEIYNTMGQQLRQENMGLGEKVSLNLSELKTGVYIALMRNEKDGSSISKKFIIQ